MTITPYPLWCLYFSTSRKRTAMLDCTAGTMCTQGANLTRHTPLLFLYEVSIWRKRNTKEQPRRSFTKGKLAHSPAHLHFWIYQ